MKERDKEREVISKWLEDAEDIKFLAKSGIDPRSISSSARPPKSSSGKRPGPAKEKDA